jgi:predicted transcriptional regulator
MTEQIENNDLIIDLTANVVAAYVSNNAIPLADLPSVIGEVHAALKGTLTPVQADEKVPQKPVVSIKKSVTPDYIICLEDGQRFKSLKRHLSTHYNMTPDEYRAKWKLPADYPMVAPNYAAARSALAKSMGLGHGGRGTKKQGAASKRGRK